MEDKNAAVAFWGAFLAASGPMFGEYAIVAICALWGALVALTRHNIDPNLTTWQKHKSGLSFIFVCWSFGTIGTGLAVYIERQYLKIDVGYLTALSAFTLAVIGPHWPEIIMTVVEKFTGKRGT